MHALSAGKPAGPDGGRPGTTTRVDRRLRLLLRADTLRSVRCINRRLPEPPGRTRAHLGRDNVARPGPRCCTHMSLSRALLGAVT
eukprot:3690404-Alexandrium_andersonii.AAC.1